MADTESIKNGSNTLTSLIPDFFYTFIGRVIPGFLFIIGLVYTLDKKIIFRLLFNESITLKEPEIVLKYDPPYTLVFILLLILSYASGLMLSVIGDLLGRKSYIPHQYKKMLEHYPYIIERLWDLAKFKKNGLPKDWESEPEVKNFCESISDEKCLILFQRQHDHVKQEYAHQARSLSQAEAEGQLCIITSVAYLVLFSFVILLAIFPKLATIFSVKFSPRCDLLIVYGAITIFSFIAALYRNKRFLMRQFSYSAEIKRREDDAKKRGRTFKIIRG